MSNTPREEITPQEALIYLMVMISAADASMSDAELGAIGEVCRKFPLFAAFDQERLPDVARACAEVMGGPNGLDRVLDIAENALPHKLRETAYAAVIEVAAADEHVEQEELRALQLIRDKLGLDRLVTVAIERSARARHMTL